MAMSSLSQPRDNLLEALRILVEERKKEAKEVFLELRTTLEQCEERLNKELCKIYSDTRERVERDERKIGKLETAKVNLQTDLVDNEFNSILQTTVDNFDAQIAEIRRSSLTIPRDVELEWNIEELKKSLERVCRIISSTCDARKTVQASDAISHPNEEKRVLAEQLIQVEAEVHRLKKENKVFKEKLKTAEVQNQDNILKLKMIEELELNLTTKETELLHLNAVVRDLEKEKIPLEKNISLRAVESGDLRTAVAGLGSELDVLKLENISASSPVASYTLNSKTPVTMTWFLEAREQTKEKEIYFFAKNGEMFTFTSEDAKGLGNASKDCFKCDCVMEVGEHEGSLNVGNLGVFEVIPFKVERRDPSYQVTIKLASRDDELLKGTKPTVQSSGNSHSQLSKVKGVSNKKVAETNLVQPQLREQLSTENFEYYIKSVLAQKQYLSKAAHRSSKQVTIFLYGKSGDGKFSTLNYLFDTNIIPAKKGRSITRKVTEYRCTVKSPFWSVNNLNVSFIDTPGFGDTEGEETDIENLSKISHFIAEHPELGNNYFNPDRVYPELGNSEAYSNWVYPNIVLIVISASDERLCGIYSIFSKMLHVLSKLNVVDKFHPNVVIAVTHAMHLSRDEYIEGTKSIEDICKVLTRAHFSFEAPVMFIENLDYKKEMELEGDWKILPDGTRQPLNMFHAMTHLMKQSGDEIGIEAVRLLFSESRKYDIESIRTTPQKLNLKHAMAQWERNVSEKFFSKKDNAIYSILKDAIDSDDFRIFPLVYNLYKVKVVNLATLKAMDLLKIKHCLYPYQLTIEEREWLVHLFEVSRIKIKLDFKSLGMGYSRQFKDKRKRILTICPLEKKKIGNYEIQVPEYCTAKELRQVTIDILYDKDAKWLLMKYLKLTFRISYVLFQVEISDIGRFGLNGTFVKKLEQSLPEGADTLEFKFENPTFTSFVKDYALHCTTGLYFGGCIEGELYFNCQKDEKTSKIFLAEKTRSLTKQLEIYFDFIQSGKDPSREHFLLDKESISKLLKCSLTCSGGTKDYHVKSLLDMNVDNWNSWTNSIENNTICIERMVNSAFIGDILSSSYDENIRSYAKELNPIKTEKQTDLTDLNFQNPLDSIPLVDTTNPLHSSHTEEPVLTRVQATDRAKPWCPVM